MAETSIEWTDRSINPIRARHRHTGAVGHYCELFSSGCKNCYASNFQKRFGLPVFPGKPRKPTPSTLDGRQCVVIDDTIEIFLDEAKLAEVVRRRKAAKWFWCDMTDLFGSWVPDQWIDRCFAVMALTPQHTHQVLTKRAERMQKYSVSRTRGDKIAAANVVSGGGMGVGIDQARFESLGHWYDDTLPNVWLGVSAEDQQRADERISWLLKTPAAVRFVSAEPLLGPVHLRQWLPCESDGMAAATLGRYHDAATVQAAMAAIDWVIVGGESGHGARPMHPDWARSIRDQCQAAGVPFFFKQWGEWEPQADFNGIVAHSGKGKTLESVVHNGVTTVFSRAGKKAAGRLLDGREWSEYPKAAKSAHA